MANLVIIVSAVLVLSSCGQTDTYTDSHRQTRMNALLPAATIVSNSVSNYVDVNVYNMITSDARFLCDSLSELALYRWCKIHVIHTDKWSVSHKRMRNYEFIQAVCLEFNRIRMINRIIHRSPASRAE